MRVLIVDENKERGEMFASLLSKYCGYCETDTVVNGRDAVLSFVRNHDAGTPFTFICMRHPLPIVDGLEALQQIRFYENEHAGEPSKCSVCIISARSDCQKLFTDFLGCDPHASFMSHPVNLFELLTLIRESHAAYSRKVVPAQRSSSSFARIRQNTGLYA